MPKKPQPPSRTPPAPDRPMFVTWGEGNETERAAALRQVSAGLARAEPVVRSHGSNLYLNIGTPSTSVRDSFDRGDYESFRPGEALPCDPLGSVRACRKAYRNVGIVSNVVDLMADFASQGVDLVHPNERIERFYKEWFRRVRGSDRSERFLNMLYREGNVVVTRRTYKVPVRVEDEMRRSSASPDIESDDLVKPSKREIPWRYTLRSALQVEVLSEELTLFVGEDHFAYAVKVPRSLVGKIKDPKTELDRQLVAKLPDAVVAAVRRGDLLVPLDREKTRAFHYKKDDDEPWAYPMAHPILSDLQGLQKMKLADLAALDGAISCIRVWKLGNIDARLMPTAEAINRLAEMLCNNVGGGVMDLVWGPDIELIETDTSVHQFLGQTKYEPVLTAIYAGLGVPPSLTGSSKEGGFTNNFISLKTLVERLQYGRDRLAEFWEEEIRQVQKAMGFRFPAKLVFSHMTLTDEGTRHKLLMDLCDRGLISDESLREELGMEADIEEIRVRREARRRKNRDLPPKAGPFHVAEKDHQKEMGFISQGAVTPSEVGLELEEKSPGEKSVLDRQEEQTVKQTKMQMQSQREQMDHDFKTQKLQLKHGVHPGQIEKQALKGQPGQGRPKQAKDQTKRKQKVVRPRTSAEFLRTLAWAESAQAKIAAVAGPALLKALGKKTMRELTDAEARDFETLKFHALCRLEPGSEVDDAVAATALSGDLSAPAPVCELLKAAVSKHAESTGKEPSADVLRRYQAGAVALWSGDYSE